MPASGPQRRFCIVNPGGGSLTVRLLANQALRAGADFRIVRMKPEKKEVREVWKLVAGDTGVGEHEVKLKPRSLGSNVMAWQVLVCSLIPGVEAGTVEIQVVQDGVTCPVTKPTQWALERVPRCEGRARPLSIRGHLTFLTA
ncbi:MAG TPA: hypothetical protein VNJ71_04820 [Gemmatimonadales bacterium]|jgi:hypothetical protein|nr:hypothetical protein [Gemmatimonadales bacterium]